jgi:hypothetical protein
MTDPNTLEDRLADDAVASKVGKYLAFHLGLRPDPEHSDRWRTGWGTKTNAGLARTILRMLEGEIAK